MCSSALPLSPGQVLMSSRKRGRRSTDKGAVARTHAAQAGALDALRMWHGLRAKGRYCVASSDTDMLLQSITAHSINQDDRDAGQHARI